MMYVPQNKNNKYCCTSCLNDSFCAFVWTGLQHDREWLLSGPSGEVLTQKKVLLFTARKMICHILAIAYRNIAFLWRSQFYTCYVKILKALNATYMQKLPIAARLRMSKIMAQPVGLTWPYLYQSKYPTPSYTLNPMTHHTFQSFEFYSLSNWSCCKDNNNMYINYGLKIVSALNQGLRWLKRFHCSCIFSPEIDHLSLFSHDNTWVWHPGF